MISSFSLFSFQGALPSWIISSRQTSWISSKCPTRRSFSCFHKTYPRCVCRFNLLVGLSGLEPPTSRLSGVRSNRLSYKPISWPEANRLFAFTLAFLQPFPCPASRSFPSASSGAMCLQALSAGGDKRDRTVDPLLAKQVLSQLSYTPMFPFESLRGASLPLTP